jgi:hypothetical protein
MQRAIKVESPLAVLALLSSYLLKISRTEEDVVVLTVL